MLNELLEILIGPEVKNSDYRVVVFSYLKIDFFFFIYFNISRMELDSNFLSIFFLSQVRLRQAH